MHQSDYKLIANSELRNVLRNVCNGPDFAPGRKELRAQLVAALPDAETDVIDALMTKAEAFAREAEDHGARFDLRGRADALTLHVLKTYEAADRLVPRENTEPVDVKDVINGMDTFGEKALASISSSLDRANLEKNARQS
jgi:hypothetical protein